MIERFESDGETTSELLFWPIDNTKRPNIIGNVIGVGDPVLEAAQRRIDDLVRAEAYIREEVPFNWLQLKDRLDRLVMETGKQVVDLDEVEGLAGQCGLPCGGAALSLRQELRAVLALFHQLGWLTYHDEPGLRDLV